VPPRIGPQPDMKRIAIVGAGFSGVTAAASLASAAQSPL
jgi:cation diffusion facilitator CzcD-associated flavoprotein CzcO